MGREPPSRAGPDAPGRRERSVIVALCLVTAVVLVGVVTAGAVSDPATGSGGTGGPQAGHGESPSATGVPPAHLEWSACPGKPGYRCGTLRVPLDYRQPPRGAVDLAVIEHPAPGRAGVVVFNPGGPGESGVEILPLLVSLVPAAVRDRFTLVSFDERGTGSSDPLLCGPSPAAAGSAVAGTAAAARTFAGLESSCRARYPELLPTVTTTTSARDMDRLRAALGAPRINYYGLSYGTALGAVYRQLFPTHVRSMVLDGAVDPDLSLATEATEEAPAIQAALVHELEGCAAHPGCPLGADPVASYRNLQRRLARTPLAAPGGGDPVPVTEGDLATATLLYLSVPDLTPGFYPALVAAAAGNGSPLRSVALGLETDINGNSLVGPLWAITCNDTIGHPDGRTTAALARWLAARYPLGGAEAVANNLIGCPGWTGSGGAIARVTPVRAATPLVIGNTGDPNTPYSSALRLAADLDGRLVTYAGYGHTWLLNGSADRCMQDVVGAYLVDGVLPTRGTRCAA